MKSINLPWIIHIFAVLHAVVALGCRLGGVDDELLLTILTMALALIICVQKGMKIEFTAAIIIVTNIIGFLLGTLGANVLQSFIRSEYAIFCLSTFITTEILGWCIIAITNIFGQKIEKTDGVKSSPYLKWILLTATGIFAIRLFIIFILSRSPLEQEVMFDIIRKVMTNSFALIVLACVNIMFIRSLASRAQNASKFSIALLYGGFMILAALLETFLIGMEGADFILIFIVAMIAQITVYCIVYMINYATTARTEMNIEKEKANMAQYRYLKLKRQVDPHFLFNSLNILDCLISDDKTEQASIYTHKLAAIYRYMIKSEDEEVVPLRDEMAFVDMYVDLLRVRFPEGFDVIVDVPQEQMSRFVPPCSIQLLIENATKHNAVSVDNPLVIKVEAAEDHVRVSNNIIPKMTRISSTGLGQKYIRQLYLDLSGKNIEIGKTDGTYSVTLPLL